MRLAEKGKNKLKIQVDKRYDKLGTTWSSTPNMDTE